MSVMYPSNYDYGVLIPDPVSPIHFKPFLAVDEWKLMQRKYDPMYNDCIVLFQDGKCYTYQTMTQKQHKEIGELKLKAEKMYNPMYSDIELVFDDPPEEPLWLETDLVPAIMANPEYYMSMIGKWDRGTSSTGPK